MQIAQSHQQYELEELDSLYISQIQGAQYQSPTDLSPNRTTPEVNIQIKRHGVCMSSGISRKKKEYIKKHMKRHLLFQVVHDKKPVFEASRNIEEDQEKKKEQKEMDKQFKDIKNITIQILDFQSYSAIIKDLVSKINKIINDIVNGLSPEEHKLYHELAMLNCKTLKPNEKWSKQDITVRFMVAIDVASLFLLRNYQYQQLSHDGIKIIHSKTISKIYKVPFLKPHRFRKLLQQNIDHMAFKYKEQIGNLVDQVFNIQMRMRLKQGIQVIDETIIEKKDLTRLQDRKIAPGIQDQSKILFNLSEIFTAAGRNRLFSSKKYSASRKNAIKNEMLVFKNENYLLVKEKLIKLAIKYQLKLSAIAQFFQEIRNCPQEMPDVNQISTYKVQNFKWLLFTPKKFGVLQSLNNILMQQYVGSKRLSQIRTALCSQSAERLVQIIKVNKCLRKILHFQPCETIYIQKYQISYKDYKIQSDNNEGVFTLIIGVVDFKVVYTNLIPKKINSTTYTNLVIKEFENSWHKKNYEAVLFDLKIKSQLQDTSRNKAINHFQSKRNGSLRFIAEPWYYSVHVALFTMLKLSLKEDSPFITLQNFEETAMKNLALVCKAVNATNIKTSLSKIRNISQ